jgi:hypothetical protein
MRYRICPIGVVRPPPYAQMGVAETTSNGFGVAESPSIGQSRGVWPTGMARPSPTFSFFVSLGLGFYFYFVYKLFVISYKLLFLLLLLFSFYIKPFSFLIYIYTLPPGSHLYLHFTLQWHFCKFWLKKVTCHTFDLIFVQIDKFDGQMVFFANVKYVVVAIC